MLPTSALVLVWGHPEGPPCEASHPSESTIPHTLILLITATGRRWTQSASPHQLLLQKPAPCQTTRARQRTRLNLKPSAQVRYINDTCSRSSSYTGVSRRCRVQPPQEASESSYLFDSPRAFLTCLKGDSPWFAEKVGADAAACPDLRLSCAVQASREFVGLVCGARRRRKHVASVKRIFPRRRRSIQLSTSVGGFSEPCRSPQGGFCDDKGLRKPSKLTDVRASGRLSEWYEPFGLIILGFGLIACRVDDDGDETDSATDSGDSS
jgi:hypothetical protein